MLDQTRKHVRRFITVMDERLCAAEDERARKRGWRITRTGFGKRRYRDPRFPRTACTAAPDEAPATTPERS